MVEEGLCARNTQFYCFTGTKEQILTQVRQVRMVEEGCVPAMVNLLRSPVESIQEHAAVTLRNLSLNDGLDPITSLCILYIVYSICSIYPYL